MSDLVKRLRSDTDSAEQEWALMDEAADRIEQLEHQLSAAVSRGAELMEEVERERIRLAACGCAAIGYFDGCKDEYHSASLDDVLRLQEKLAACQKERDEMLSTRSTWDRVLQEKLAAAQAREAKLREALEVLRLKTDPKYGWPIIDEALSTQVDDTALRQYVAKELRSMAETFVNGEISYRAFIVRDCILRRADELDGGVKDA